MHFQPMCIYDFVPDKLVFQDEKKTNPTGCFTEMVWTGNAEIVSK